VPEIPTSLADLGGEHDNAVTAAKRLLVAVSSTSPEAMQLAEQLARLDIVERGGACALEVLAGGPFALVRAVQLAEVLLGAKSHAVAGAPPSPPGFR
jgi:hypothetical protein